MLTLKKHWSGPLFFCVHQINNLIFAVNVLKGSQWYIKNMTRVKGVLVLPKISTCLWRCCSVTYSCCHTHTAETPDVLSQTGRPLCPTFTSALFLYIPVQFENTLRGRCANTLGGCTEQLHCGELPRSRCDPDWILDEWEHQFYSLVPCSKQP